MRLGTFLSTAAMMALFMDSQFSSTVLVECSWKNSLANVAISALIAGQSAFENKKYWCGFFLLYTSLTFESTRIAPSWSEIFGTVLVNFINVGLFVIYKSKILATSVLFRTISDFSVLSKTSLKFYKLTKSMIRMPLYFYILFYW